MKSLRARLFAYLGLAVLVSAVLTVGVAALLTRRSVENQTLDQMRERLNVAVGILDDLAGPAGRTRLRQTFALQRELLLPPDVPAGSSQARLRAALLATGRASGSLDVLGRHVLYVVAESPEGPVVLAREASLDFGPFVRSLLLAGLGGAVVASVLSYVLARRLVRPLRAVSAASERLASGEAGVRVAVEGEDELADLARSFNRMARDLQAAREAERTFLMSVSHELKTPLTAIRGYAEALRDGAETPGEAGRVVQAEAERLERLVRDLLDLARLDQRRFSVAREPVDLARVAGEARRRYASRAREFGVDLVAEVADAADGTAATGDRGRLLQVVSNLVENALRVTPAGGRVTVRAGRGSLEVADTGPGLAPEDLPRAFDRFYLHRRYATDRGVGSGLGLAIVKELVEAMGGAVAVSSTPGAGTTFRISLPRAGEAGAGPAADP